MLPLSSALPNASVRFGLVLGVVDAIVGVVVVVVVEALLFKGLDCVCTGESDLSPNNALGLSSFTFFWCPLT